jgi:hypothetical protein
MCAIASPAHVAAAAKLIYNGGPLVSNADVVMVNWSGNVPADVQAQLPAFYDHVLQSDYWTVLLEYATQSQTIGFGTFDSAVTIAPSKCAGVTACTVDDTDIRAELGAQIDAGHLPSPITDVGGRSDTVYMVHFAPNVTVTLQGVSSCVYFCSYNSSFTHDSKLVIFGVVPDQSGGCFNGCGGSTSTHVDKETVVASALLANAATDAGAGVNQVGWYDNQAGGGQIADICNGNSADVVADGASYYVNKLWSNSQNACATSSGRFVVQADAAAFGTIAPSGPQAVLAGQNATFTVSADTGFQASVAGSCGGVLSGTTFTTNAITADCNVSAAFDRIFADGFQ